MRRLLAVTAAVVAAFAAPAGAHPPDSPVPCYGVVAGDVQAGVCAGGYCTDLCFVVVDPYCEGLAPKYCGAIDRIGG